MQTQTQWPWLKRVKYGEASLRQELDALRAMPRHENVVSMVDYWREPEKEKSVLALDYLACGSLERLLDRAAPRALPLPQARLLFRGLMAGLAHMHRCGVYHRDIKPDNLLLASATALAISDFGTATRARSTPGVGAPAFQPPEVAATGTAPFSDKLDVWAAGLTLFMMVTGRYPFRTDGTAYQKYAQIAREPVAIPPALPAPLRALLAGMLEPDPARRLAVRDVRRHPWLAAHDTTITYIDVRPRPTVFTRQNVQRFRRQLGRGARVDLVRGDEIPPEDEEALDADPRIRVRTVRPPFHCPCLPPSHHCSCVIL